MPSTPTSRPAPEPTATRRLRQDGPMVAPPLPRQQFPVAERYVYLNHAGIGPIPQRRRRAIRRRDRCFRDDGGLALRAL